MKIRIVGLVILVTWGLGGSQEIGDYISKYTSANGKKYMQPLADVFSSDLNSGVFEFGRLPKLGLKLTIGVKGMSTAVSGDQRTFTATTEEPFNPTQSVKVPTLFGKNEVVSVTGSGGTVYNFPSGFNLDKLPLVVPQVSIGSILGTELTVRYFMANVGEDIGDLTLTGIGVRHSLSQYLPLFPLDVSIGYFTQKFSVGEVVDATTVYYGAQVGKSFGILSLYGAAGYESADMAVEYEQDPGDQASKISFDLQSEQQLRFTLGVGLKLAILKIHADYNFANQQTVCAGVGLGW
jgi:hypothetical protein